MTSLELRELSEELKQRADGKQPLLSEHLLAIDVFWDRRPELDSEDSTNLSRAIRLALYSALFLTPEFEQVERDRLAVQAVDRLKTLYGGSGCSPNHCLDLARSLCFLTYNEPSPERRYEIAQEISALHDIAQEPEVRIALAQALYHATYNEPRPERCYEIAQEISALHDIKQEPEVRIWLAQVLAACIAMDSRVIARRSYQVLVGLAKQFGTEGLCAPLAVAFWQAALWTQDLKRWQAAFDFGIKALELEAATQLRRGIENAVASSIPHLDFSYVRDRLGRLLTSSLTKFIASPADQALFGTTESEMQIFEQAVSLLAGHSTGTRAAHTFLQQFRGVSAWKRDYTGGATDAQAVLAEIVRDNVELDHHTLVLEYVVAADKTLIFASNRTGIESYELTVVGKSIGREKSEDNSHLNWEEHLSSKQFAQLHVLPIQVQHEINRHRRVVICAFGELSTFSFSSLPALKDKLICHAYSMSDHIRLRKQPMPSNVGPKVMSLCAGHDLKEKDSILRSIVSKAEPGQFSTKYVINPVKSAERFNELFPGSKVLGHYESTPEAFESAYMASPPPGCFVYLGHNDVVQAHPFLRLVNEDGDEEPFFTKDLQPRKERIPIGLFNACKGTEGGASVEAHNSSGYRFILSGCRTAIVTTIKVDFGALNHFVVPFLLEQLATGVTAEYALFNLRKAYESGKLLADYQSEETALLTESKLREAVYAFVLFGDPEGKL